MAKTHAKTQWSQYRHVLQRLRQVKFGRRWARALCPAHQTGDEHDRGSLALEIGDNGKLIVVCHAGCANQQVLAAIGMTYADLRPDAAPHKKARQQTKTTKSQHSKNKEPRMEPQAEYIYRDEQENNLFKVVRYLPKDFRQFRWDSEHSKWEPGIAQVRRVLYRLPELLTADRSRAVFLLEGEKAVDYAREKLGLVATCNPMGARKWLPEYNQSLADLHVIAVGDRDDVGELAVLEAGEALKATAASVKLVYLDGVQEHDGLDDWIELRGGSLEKLQEIVKASAFFFKRAPQGRAARKTTAPLAENQPASEPGSQTSQSSSKPRPFDPVAAMKHAAAGVFADADRLPPGEWLVAARARLIQFETRMAKDLFDKTVRQNRAPQTK